MLSRSGRGRASGALWLVLSVVWLVSSVAWANEGKPIYKDPRLLPTGADAQGIAGVTIRREHLSFDFRPIDDGEAPTVLVHYELDNEGEALSVPLVFASFLIEDATVRFDERDVIVRPLKSDELPPAWDTPDGPVRSVTAQRPDASGLAFTLEISPGPHELEVRYRIGEDFGSWEPAGWVIPYALAPARSWQALDVLALSVACPPRWTCQVFAGLQRNPAEARRDRQLQLDRDDGVLHGQWNGLPTDLITILVVRPKPWWLVAAGLLLRAAALLLLLGLVYVAARRMSHAQSAGARFLRWLLLAPLVVGMSCGGGVLLAQYDSWIEPVTGGYDDLEWMLLAGALGVLAAVVGLPLGSLFFRRQTLG